MWVGIRVQFHVFLILWCPEKSAAQWGSWTFHWVSLWGASRILDALMGTDWLTESDKSISWTLKWRWEDWSKCMACSWPAQLTDACVAALPKATLGKCSNTREESTHKYERPKCLRWVS